MTLVYDDEISNGEVTPVVLLGAPRSGTQMYRDMICSHPEISTWPYNEMTYMWRYGNRSHPTDEIPPSLLTSRIASYIRGSFIKLSKKTNSPLVVDKTCHNCLRPDYVQAVLPEAKYIYLIRHAMDVVPSTVKRSENPTPRQEFTRVMSIPPLDVPYYVARMIWNQGSVYLPGERKARMWGPRFTGMNELAASGPMEHVYAHQWVRHIDLADEFLDDDRFDSPLLRVRYEEITKDPAHALKQVFDYLDVSTPQWVVDQWIDEVRYREPGGNGHLLGEHEAGVAEIVAAANARHGYQ